MQLIEIAFTSVCKLEFDFWVSLDMQVVPQNVILLEFLFYFFFIFLIFYELKIFLNRALKLLRLVVQLSYFRLDKHLIKGQFSLALLELFHAARVVDEPAFVSASNYTQIGRDVFDVFGFDLAEMLSFIDNHIEVVQTLLVSHSPRCKQLLLHFALLRHVLEEQLLLLRTALARLVQQHFSLFIFVWIQLLAARRPPLRTLTSMLNRTLSL